MTSEKKRGAWPLSLGWSVALGVFTLGFGLVFPFAIFLHRKGHSRAAYVTAGIGGLLSVLMVISIATSSDDKGTSNAAASSKPVAKAVTRPRNAAKPAEVAVSPKPVKKAVTRPPNAAKPTKVVSEPTETVSEPEPRANIYVIASRSFCVSSGIDDAYTGNGHVIFSVMLRNSGTADGSVDVTPVRHYDDGEMNDSPLDTMTVDVPAGERKQVNSPQFTYKAHEHEVASCGVVVDGRDEVDVYSTSASDITGS
jgi:hypothetical protein